MNNVRFMNLSISKDEQSEIFKALSKVFDSGIFINGPELEEFECKFASYIGKNYGSGVCSGTGSLYYGMRALGIGNGDEVITTSLSWIATANAIASTGASPVFADINDDLNINPEKIEGLISKKTKAILPVHYAGRVCDMKSILEIARKHNLLVIEDASQAAGAKKCGDMAGSFGDISCFSLNPMKILGGVGEAGIVLANCLEIKNKIDILRYNGTINKETCVQTSLNGRMDTIQSAILLLRLKTLQDRINKRKNMAIRYHNELKGIVELPLESIGEENSWYSYTIQVDNRDDLQKYLFDRGIETKIQHPILMPNQPVYQKCLRSDLSNAERIVSRILCLPLYENLSDNEQGYVIKNIREFYGK